ncbi:MAG: ornithine cyclodeaminase, partial [Pseudomonadota bacterium]
ALRTAATAALGARYLARPDSAAMGIIGTGAQAEFQVLALAGELPLRTVYFTDPDANARAKFVHNLADSGLHLVSCPSAEKPVSQADLLVTATAARRRARLFPAAAVRAGTHIHALGGDAPGKTELDPSLVERSTVVVEYLDQTRHEGEIQNAACVEQAVELHRLVSGDHPGRTRDDEITLFDAVGFALEDFSVLTLVLELADALEYGERIPFFAPAKDPKNLFGWLLEWNAASTNHGKRRRVRP